MPVNSHATLVLVWPGHESWWNSHAKSRLSTLMQLLFSFDQDMRVDETLMQTLACKLSPANSRLSTLMQPLGLVWPGHESWWNSHAKSRLSTLMRTLACKLSCKLSLVNSHANSWSRLTRTRELMKLSSKLSVVLICLDFHRKHPWDTPNVLYLCTQDILDNLDVQSAWRGTFHQWTQGYVEEHWWIDRNLFYLREHNRRKHCSTHLQC